MAEHDSASDLDLESFRWTLDEYLLRCEQGDDLREVLVEGELDRDVVTDAFERWGTSGVLVLDSDYLSVSDEAVVAAGFTTGVKGVLSTVAKALAGIPPARLRGAVVVVVDRDWDGVDPDDAGLLLATDGHSMESYIANAATLDRLLRVTLGRAELPRGRARAPVRRTTCSGAELCERVCPAAVATSAVRCVLQRLPNPPPLPKKWIEQARTDAGGFATMDGERLTRVALNPVDRVRELDRVLVQVTEEIPRVCGDIFLLVRGHDFVCILLKVLRSRWGSTLTGSRFVRTSERDLSRLLFSVTDTAALDSYPLFRDLRTRFREP